MQKARAQTLAATLGATVLFLGVAVGSVAIAQTTPSANATAATASSRPISTGFAPDPPPIRSATQWMITFEYKHGKVSVRDVKRVQLRAPISTQRRMGRYAAELLSGPTVVERVRFDFPLVGADELAGQRRPFNAPPYFEGKTTVTHRIMLPDTPRASQARLVDRATGQSFAIPWPPAASASPPARSSGSHGSPDAGSSVVVDAALGVDHAVDHTVDHTVDHDASPDVVLNAPASRHEDARRPTSR